MFIVSPRNSDHRKSKLAYGGQSAGAVCTIKNGETRCMWQIDWPDRSGASSPGQIARERLWC
jgi:hypothetical protein